MGGFRVNGCGATDHYKKVKSLGMHMCPNCKKFSEFFLEEAKFKIDVFFIPTFTLKSRYAVMCSKCEKGEFCSDQWASNLFNSTGQIQILFESQAQQADQIVVSEEVTAPVPEAITYESASTNPSVTQTASPVSEAITYAPPEQKAQQPIPKKISAPSFFKCPHCGVTQLCEGVFCSYCGKPVSEIQDAPNQNQDENALDEMSTCPTCGNRQKSGMKFCYSCGNTMEVKLSSERVCPGCSAKIEGDAAFCMECGMKL